MPFTSAFSLLSPNDVVRPIHILRALPLAFVLMAGPAIAQGDGSSTGDVGSAGASETNAAPPKTTINPASLPDATQFGYSQATVAAPGAQLVHVAGQVGYVEDEADNGFGAQAERAFANLDTALREAGSDPNSVVHITLLIVDHDADKLAVMGERRKAMFGDALPASILIPVPKLYAPGVLFEIGAVAVAIPK